MKKTSVFSISCSKKPRLFLVSLLTVILLSIFANLRLCPTLGVEASTTLYDYDVPCLNQRDYKEIATNGLPIGDAACGPTSIAMLLRYYFPNSRIEGSEIYHSGTQTYLFEGPAVNYKPEFQGMAHAAATSYLNRVWGGDAVATAATRDDVIEEIRHRPLLLNILGDGRGYWTDKNGDGKIQAENEIEVSGHFVVLRHYDDRSTSENYEDDLFLVNDPWEGQERRELSCSQLFGKRSWHEITPSMGYNCKTDTGWFKDRIIKFDPALSEGMRKYTVVVDDHNVKLDDIEATYGSGDYVWWEWYHHSDDLAGNWYFPMEAGHSAKWIPDLPVDGNYEIHVIFRKDNDQSDVTYTIYAPDNSKLGQKVVGQKGEGWADENLGIFPLVKGSYVKVDNVPAQCNVDAVRFVYTPASFVPVDLVLVLDSLEV